MADETDPPSIWMAKKYFDECSLQFRSIWDLYLKFYVTFLTVNGAALALTVQYVTGSKAKAVIAITFIFQNVLAAGTAVAISKYSSDVAKRAQGLAELVGVSDHKSDPVALPAILHTSPIPGHIGRWGGIANLLGHVLFVVLWLVVIFVDFHPSK
jgi:hypothetical protein